MDPTLRFSNRAEDYIKYRPRYPREVIETMREAFDLTSSATIADIGSGTGALTEVFLENGNLVFAVEPNRAMRETAERVLSRYPTLRSISGRAESTTLEYGSVDYVVVGQAFHWFATRETHREFLRILRPPFPMMVVWNEREYDTTPFLTAYDQLLQRYGKDYARERHKGVYDTALNAFYGIGGCTERTFCYTQEVDFAGLKGRMMSSSYTPEQGHPDHAPMVEELSRIYEKYRVNGIVTLRYITRMYYGTLSS